MRSLPTFLLALCGVACAWAPLAFGDAEVQGVLINETRSVAGQAFYSGFFSVWQARDPEGLYSLVVSEKPYPRHPGASLITVTYENQAVLTQVVQFNAGRARAAGERATEYVFTRVLETEMKSETADPDMAASGY